VLAALLPAPEDAPAAVPSPAASTRTLPAVKRPDEEMQTAFPCAALSPGPHGVHVADPAAEIVFKEHWSHAEIEDCPVIADAVPAAQEVHEAAPAAAL